MQVELLTNGHYIGADACIGKVFAATKRGRGYMLAIRDLEMAGYLVTVDTYEDLYFFAKDVRVIDA